MYLFAFRSRTQSMRTYDLFRSNGLNCAIINSPRDISTSCGLSVRVQDAEYERAYDIYDYYRPDTLIGIYYHDGYNYKRV